MLKINKKALIDVFSGWMNRRARDIANDMGNRTADAYSISLVQQTLGKMQGLKGFFELAASGFTMSRTSGSSGRAFKPFLLHPEPR